VKHLAVRVARQLEDGRSAVPRRSLQRPSGDRHEAERMHGGGARFVAVNYGRAEGVASLGREVADEAGDDLVRESLPLLISSDND
jgi:hypothetical protein